MNVWILQTGEPIHCDSGSPRPMRAMNLTNALIDRGHSVVLWTSGFYHQEKRHRCRQFESRVINKNLIINLVPSMGYQRNIGLGRLLDHAQLAWRLYRLLKTGKFLAPDIAFIGYPPIETAAVMVNWLKERNIPAVIDVKDQWPALFLEPFPKILRPIIKLALKPYFYFALHTLTNATAFSSMSQGYLDWMSRFSCRELHDLDMVVPLTAPMYKPSAEEYIEAEKWWNERGVSTLTNRRFCFVGSFMSVFDFSCIRDVAARFQMEAVDCQFVICGDGGFASDIRSMMNGLDNVIFPGWVDAPKIATLAKFSSGSLIPYKNIDNFTINIPNKVIDAFAYGLPVITTLTGEVENIVEMERVGFACNANTGRNMYDAMILLLDDQELKKGMSNRARALYNSRFVSEMVYGRLVDALERIS